MTYSCLYFVLDSPLGDVFNWTNEENNWEFSNVEKVALDTSDFCKDFPVKNYYMLPERRSLESAISTCLVMGGRVATPSDREENDLIQDIGNRYYDTCEANEQSGKTLWIGIKRNEDFEWVVSRIKVEFSIAFSKEILILSKDVETRAALDYSHFKSSHGVGNTNCAFMLTNTGRSSGKWGSALCSDQSPR